MKLSELVAQYQPVETYLVEYVDTGVTFSHDTINNMDLPAKSQLSVTSIYPLPDNEPDMVVDSYDVATVGEESDYDGSFKNYQEGDKILYVGERKIRFESGADLPDEYLEADYIRSGHNDSYEPICIHGNVISVGDDAYTILGNDDGRWDEDEVVRYFIHSLEWEDGLHYALTAYRYFGAYNIATPESKDVKIWWYQDALRQGYELDEDNNVMVFDTYADAEEYLDGRYGEIVYTIVE